MPGGSFRLPPKDSIKWVHPGNRPPLPPIPYMPCTKLLEGADLAYAESFLITHPFDELDRDVYFIRGNGVPHVKIGRARSGQLQSRLMDLQTGSPIPLSIILVVSCYGLEGLLDIECRLHELFKRYRLHGEWFSIEGDLHDFLKENGAQV